MRKLAANIVDNCLDEINRRIEFDLHGLDKKTYHDIQNALVEIVQKNLQPQDSADVSQPITPRKLAKRIRKTGEKVILDKHG